MPRDGLIISLTFRTLRCIMVRAIKAILNKLKVDSALKEIRPYNHPVNKTVCVYVQQLNLLQI